MTEKAKNSLDSAPEGQRIAIQNHGEQIQRECSSVASTRGDEGVVGLLINKNGSEVFVPRKPEHSAQAFGDSLRELFAHWDTLEILDGQVTIVINGSRKRIVEVGALEDLSSSPPQQESPIFDLSQATKRRGKGSYRKPYRITTAINQSDSFGKEQWRQKWLEEVNKAFPGGYESIPENERLVICFPGIGGKEAEMWRKWGFQEGDLIFIEKSPRIAAKLKERYPKACTIEGKLGMGRKSWENNDTIASAIVARCYELGEPQQPRKVSIINIDPENKCTPNMHKGIHAVFRKLERAVGADTVWRGGALADTMIVGVNLMFTRGKDGRSITKMDQLIGWKDEIKSDPDFEKKVMERFIQTSFPFNGVHCFPAEGVPYSFQEPVVGNYEGDSSNSRMHFAIQTITRK